MSKREEVPIVEIEDIKKSNAKPFLEDNPIAHHPEYLKYFIYIQPKSTDELETFYVLLREFEKITMEKELSVLNVFVAGNKDIEWVPSLLASAFRNDDNDYRNWYAFNRCSGKHWMVKLNDPTMNAEELLEFITHTRCYYEDKAITVVYNSIDDLEVS